MRAYYFNEDGTGQTAPHDYNPSKPVDTAVLESLGLHYWRIPVEDHEEKINAVAAERDYKNRDTINVTREGLGDLYESKIKSFYEEHLHEDEEIRYILSGSGYFDVRETPTDQWIRVAMDPGDLLVLPAGMYHRFTLDDKAAIKAMRLFKEEPKWTPINRSTGTDINPYRVSYLQSIGAAA